MARLPNTRGAGSCARAPATVRADAVAGRWPVTRAAATPACGVAERPARRLPAICARPTCAAPIRAAPTCAARICAPPPCETPNERAPPPPRAAKPCPPPPPGPPKPPARPPPPRPPPPSAPTATAAASARVGFERQKRNDEKQRGGQASAGRQQRPRRATRPRARCWRQRRRLGLGVSAETKSVQRRHGASSSVVPPNAVPPFIMVFLMMGRRSVVAVFAMHVARPPTKRNHTAEIAAAASHCSRFG